MIATKLRAALHRILPAPLARRLTRYAIPLAIVGVLLVLLAGVAVAALVSPGGFGVAAARLSQTEELPDSLQVGGISAVDTDGDGLSDALENYLYGTDPAAWNSSGLGIPDGWLVEFGYDPLSPLLVEARGAAPPADALPDAYAEGWPAKYRPPIGDYYAYAKPDDYVPGESAPWWRNAPHADPTRWDQSGTGIPTGWLVHYDLPIEGLDADRVLQGSKGNLSVRQAFEHDTDPRALDSDGDGLGDWDEIHVHQTLPNAFSTSGTGIADGWLLRFGLNPFDDGIGGQDPDRDGVTNLEEFFISHSAFQSDIEKDGIQVLFTRGLDPLDWQTAKTGIPDGWYVRYDLSPFDTEPDAEVGRASDWDHFRSWAPEGVADALRRDADLAMTVREAYAYGRPADWNETIQGVWWGGTNPATLDTDGDGMPDPVEILGWYANVTTQAGPEAKPRLYLATSNPLEADSDGDGLIDLEEYLGRTDCGVQDAPFRSFPTTDPRNRDTAFSGLTDFEKVCGAVRGDTKYDLAARETGLDPTRADTAGDYLLDGDRLDFWHERYDAYRQNPAYPYEDSAYRTVFEWTRTYARFGGMTESQVIETFRPDGDVDNDGIANVLDADPSGGLHVQKFGDAANDAASKVFFLGGPQIKPSLYASTEFASNIPHVASDPANPDTDGDGLPDSWETRFGTFDGTYSGWNLDPAKADSDGDGVLDGDANNDGDVITWYAYSDRGTGIDRESHEFAFTNRLEFVAGTDPNRLYSMADGIPDGWKAFWGSRVSDETFLNLLAARDSRVGDVALARASDLEGVIPTSNIGPLNNLKDQGDPRKVTGYVRVVADVSSCTSPEPPFEELLRDNERLAGENAASACKANVVPLDGNEANFLLIEGAYHLDYRREVDLRTNPYLTDSDGDGAPDAYEAYMLDAARGRAGGQSAQHPNPALPDGTRDVDGDGLGLADECGSRDGIACDALPGGFSFEHPDRITGLVALNAGADPNDADSDGDGIEDAIELDAGLDPLDPSDVLNFRDPTRDSDGDTVADYLELTGWGKNDFANVPARTDPQDADTDKDGLIDGDNRNLPATSALATEWLARGFAHKRLTNGTIDFYGEKSHAQAIGARPDQLDSGLTGIPDGWRALYLVGNPGDAEIQQAYSAFRPTWWNEDAHGVWWWGTPPPGIDAGLYSLDDLDGDGLNDRNGEDPFPAFNHANRVVLDGVTITDPRDVEDALDAATTPEDLRRLAQAIGDEPGDPRSNRTAARLLANPNGVPAPLDRADVELLDFAIVAGADGLDSDAPRLTKGVPFTVTGQVVLAERARSGELLEGSETERVGVANRTVIISFFAPSVDRIVGAGFTNATGHFRFNASIASDQTYTIPHDGMVLLGATNGTVHATFDSANVAAGTTTLGQQNRILAWVTNTTGDVAPGAPTHGAFRARLPDESIVTTAGTGFAVSGAINVSVFSETRFVSTVAPNVENGGKLAGDIVLQDAAGGALANQRVSIRWDGVSPAYTLDPTFTDRSGKVNITQLNIPAKVPSAGEFELTLEFRSLQPDILDSTLRAFPIQVRNPTQILVTLDNNATTVGESIHVQGILTTREVTLGGSSRVLPEGIAGAPVVIRLGGVEETAQTDEQGRFGLRMQVPGTLSAGAQTLGVQYAGDEENAPAEASVPVAVKRRALIVDLVRIEGPRSIDVTLTGRLVDNEGKGFTGAVNVLSPKGRLGSALSNPEGRFQVAVPLRVLDLGSQQIQVHFPGDLGHSSATNTTTARVTSTTTLRILDAPTQVVRGDAFELRARLVDDVGDPVRAAAVTAVWRGDRVGTAVTDAAGTVSFLVETNRSERPATTEVGLRFDPVASSVLRGSTASADVRVKAGSDLEVYDGAARRGVVRVTGLLLDDEGRPIPTSIVDVRMGDDLPIQQALVARNGSFEATFTLPEDFPLGAVDVIASYGGTATLAGSNDTAVWRIRSPATLEISQLGPFVRGERAAATGIVLDDRGQPIDLPLQFSLDGVPLGTITPSGGAFQTRFEVPTNATRGAARLDVRIAPTDEYEGLERTYDVIVKIRPRVDVALPALAIRGFAFSGEVTLLDDQGQPLRNTTFAYAVGAGGSPVTGRTDADGRAQLALVAPLTGDAAIGLTVRGGPDVVSAASTYTGVNVVGPATPIGYAGLVVVVLGILAIVGAIVAATYLRRRQLTEARDIIDEAIRELLAGNEYAGTIFLAYRRFVAHLARHGFIEKPSETPREFALGVRKALPVGAVPLRELIRLFEEARYSDHAIGSLERDRAVESLAVVRTELDRMLGKKTAAAAPGGVPS